MSVEVKLELGHRAGLREKPTSEGFTHDWTVFVRGAEGSNIYHYVDKVVFILHESFPKPKRVVKDPPYQVSESGYAGFNMPIEVYFRSKEEPKKVRFEYDLYLRTDPPPVSNIRIEKLTFQNPSDDFRRKLLKAGGVGALTSSGTGSASLQTQACAPVQLAEDSSPLSHPKVQAAIAEKKPRSHFANKDLGKPNPLLPKVNQPFTDIFGAPIKTKSSPDSNVKLKDSAQTKKISPVSAPNTSTAIKEIKTASRDSNYSETKDTKTKSSKSAKFEKEVKSTKRPTPLEGHDIHAPNEKKKRQFSTSSESSEKNNDASKAKAKNGKEKNEKSKIKATNSIKKEKPKYKTSLEGKDLKSNSQTSKHLPSPILSSLDSDSNESKKSIGNKAQYSSPASSISETSLDGHRPSSSMMSEIDNEILSPLASDSDYSPPPSPVKAKCSDDEIEITNPENKSASKTFIKKTNVSKVDKNTPNMKVNVKSKQPLKNNTDNGNILLNENHEPELIEPIQKENSLDRGELMELQQKIMSSNDRHILQKIVDVIEKTGKFQISNTSFDFDLCTLDHVTVKKLKLCLT